MSLSLMARHGHTTTCTLRKSSHNYANLLSRCQWYRVMSTIQPSSSSTFSSSRPQQQITRKNRKSKHFLNSKALSKHRRRIQTLRMDAAAAAAAAASRTELNKNTSMASTSSSILANQPTREELRRVMTHAALPMIGFGFMDQTLMIQAGNAIDCTIGVTLGLSTLAAAAVGSIVSSAGGIMFGETIQHMFTKHGTSWAAAPNLDSSQYSLASVQRAKFSGTFWGLMIGLTFGLVNLYFIDTDKSTTLKAIQALDEESKNEFAFTIEISNDTTTEHQRQAAITDNNDNKYESVTTLTIRGPDIDGILASIVNTLNGEGCSLVEMIAKTSKPSSSPDGILDDVILVRRNGKAIPEEELEDLAKKVLEATKNPLNVPTLKAKLQEVEYENAELSARIGQLTAEITKRQILNHHQHI